MILAFIILLTLVAFGFTLFIRQQDIPEPLPVSPVQHLEDRKAAIYEGLRDLQFEYRVGKLSDDDYQRSKLALQRELAGVLGEMEAITKKLGLSQPAPVQKQKAPAGAGKTCPHCGAKFSQALKFCGECGKAMA